MSRERRSTPRSSPYNAVPAVSSFGVRIGNAERDRASEVLAAHYADGRLEHDEYVERLDAIWSSRTGSDLALIFADLPQRVTPPVRPAGERYRKPTGGFPWLPVMLVLIALSILTDAPFWLLVFPAWFLWRRRQHRHRQSSTRHPRPLGHRHPHG